MDVCSLRSCPDLLAKGLSAPACAGGNASCGYQWDWSRFRCHVLSMTDGRASFSAPKVGLGRRPQHSNTQSPGCCQPSRRSLLFQLQETSSSGAGKPACVKCQAPEEQAKPDLLLRAGMEGEKLSLGSHQDPAPRQGLHRVLGGTPRQELGRAHPISCKSSGLVPRDRGFGREDKEREEDKKEKEEKEKEKTEGEKEKEKQKRRKKEEEKQGDGEEDRSSSSSDSDLEEDQGIAKDDEKEDKD
ncbi:hypothetical protein DV515_00006837 [Chloebia gouldiae]|uniref:Uncharacterized protein n=1 Tax=Chloebia gouldiae TaxID=44316 RepID=A0A3L8SJJ6_CHLGU|nr:hypothetical protein DV515_00006837 [Chloebia gouldiae]